MSTDQPQLPPLAPPPRATDPEHPPSLEAPEVMHKTRAVDFLGRRTPIIYQNDNGPCPLLAICNVLLKNVINLNPDASKVSQQKLLSLVAERLIDSNSTAQGKDEEYMRNWEHNVSDAIDLLPRLTTDINVNVLFRKIDDFEFTQECSIFDLLDIPLYHGWIDTDTVTAIGSKSYNALAFGLAELKSGESTKENKHVEEEETVDFAAATTAALGVPSPSVSQGRSFNEHTLADPEDEELRSLSLSKAKNANAVDGSVSFDTSQSHSSSYKEETAQSDIFRLKALELVDSTNKEEHGNNHALSDGSSFAPNDQAAAFAPTLEQVDKETSEECSAMQIHGQASDTEVSSELTTAASEATPTHATKELAESEPIYQGEEHILSTGNLSYENQEPVYEGEAVLAEQAGQTRKSSQCLQYGAAEHQWELTDNFLRNTASQLTGLNERELCVFFRNNHFNTMFKLTDQGFFSQIDLVWQKLDEVNGDEVFLTSNFIPFKAETPRNDSWNEQQAMTSTALSATSIS
ncbi:hypothetical protein ABZP36_010830 [Zizania latifolia]